MPALFDDALAPPHPHSPPSKPLPETLPPQPSNSTLAFPATEAERLLRARNLPLQSTETEEARAELRSRKRHPHGARRAEILTRHPEIAGLFGLHPLSGLHILALVSLQLLVAVAVALLRAPSWSVPVLAYAFGAVVCHALWVLIHDATHNLIARPVAVNRLFVVLANIPHVFPSGMLFRYYHILHHIELNDAEKDPDVPAQWEARFVGNNPFFKALWLALFFLFQSLRLLFYTYRVPTKNLAESAWIAANALVNILVIGAIFLTFGTKPLIYLLLSSIFAIGLHPLGARWIQEHYPTHPFQATYSYYGPLNRFAFNIGFHNEHHDFPSIPWNNLPALKKFAPEYYNTLFSYSSYTQLLMDFISDPKWSLLVRFEKERLAAGAAAKVQAEAEAAAAATTPEEKKKN